MNEFELIARLVKDLPQNASTLVGPGDDCAVLDLGLADRKFLLKTDAVVRGVHFQADAEPRSVGRKALARCLSDVAAMAGTPTHALVTLGLPQDFVVGWVEQLYAGLSQLAQRLEVAVVGGETVACAGDFFISVALLGWVAADRCVLRSGGKPGDALFVTGELGGSLASGHHLIFEPRLEEARWLAQHYTVHAMIDLSDGLAGDARHLLQASGCGAEIMAEAIPVRRSAKGVAREGRRSPLGAALTDGEDFELLFTVPAEEAVRLLDAWKQRFPGIRLSCIGRLMQDRRVMIRNRDASVPLTMDGYQHFQKS